MSRLVLLFQALRRSLSGMGLLLGTLFFAAALTPSLAPRSFVMQGVLCGVAFSCGYGLGYLLRLLWRYLELPEPGAMLRRRALTVIGLACLAAAIAALALSVGWQNAIHAVMRMEPVDSAYPLRVSALALLSFFILLLLVRCALWLGGCIVAAVRRYLPRKAGTVLGVSVTAALLWTLVNGVLVQAVFTLADRSFQEYDALIEPERPQPAQAGKTGGPGSLLAWKDLGRAGREFVASAPGAADIRSVTGRDALDPVRVYAGLNVGQSVQDRARQALAELIRQGGFQRDVLVIITPTGTGWVDPAAIDGLEYLHDGNVASVAMQYSYLNSPLSLLFQADMGADSARALFSEVYGYWKQLPRQERPRLYLHGLSLGAMNSEKSLLLFEMLEDPIHGALWSGPPFMSSDWRRITRDRNAGSPAWLPVFRDGAFVRFLNQDGQAPGKYEDWGPLRIVYLQYASDAVTFFDQHALYRQPEWMNAPRGPDVSSQFRWYPVVTFLQLALDMSLSMGTPLGYGHVYAPEHYIDAWREVAPGRSWSDEDLLALKQHLRRRMLAAQEDLRGG